MGGIMSPQLVVDKRLIVIPRMKVTIPNYSTKILYFNDFSQESLCYFEELVSMFFLSFR